MKRICAILLPFLAMPLLAAKCTENEVTVIDTDAQVRQLLEVEPRLLHFGEVPWDEDVTLSLTLRNVGDAGLYVDQVDLEGSGAFTLVEPWGRTLLDPGAEAVIDVRYTPSGPEDEGGLVVRSDDTAIAEVPVQLLGSGLYPLLQILPPEIDFGEVAVCNDDEREVILLNRGDADLHVSGVALTGDGLDPVGAEVPFTLAPSETRYLTLRFAPVARGPYAGTLWVESDDISGTDTAPISGTGTHLSITEYLDTFRQPEQPWHKADVLFFVDQSASMDNDAARLNQGFSTLARRFNDDGVDWQVIVVTDDDGCANEGLITSTDPYAGTTFSEAVWGPSGLLAESGLSVALAALSQTGAGGCNEGFLREDAKPLLVMISDEAEQSGTPWEELLTAIQGYAPSASVAAVVGDFPDGCEGASPGAGYHHAAMASQGVSLSVCSTDWTDHFQHVAALVDEPTDTFPLSYTPDPATVTVEIDGVLSSAWSYDPVQNAIITDTMPAGGSLIRIGYALTTACD
ncbi:MAG: choice-of-anchor D domain-containing protein [Deltaproteobacteria bacterium]|nr:choice-of-anchor D domain-containing protein [Deltaproteobacteria bacterium]